MKSIKALLPEYNACQMAIDNHTSSLSIQEALDPTILSKMLHPHSSVPSKTRQDLIDAHIQVQRACEEVEMLKAEMGNMVIYFKERCKTLQDSIQLFKTREYAFGRGGLSLLKSMYLHTDSNLQNCVKLFEVTNEAEVNEDSDCESDLKCSSDDDYTLLHYYTYNHS